VNNTMGLLEAVRGTASRGSVSVSGDLCNVHYDYIVLRTRPKPSTRHKRAFSILSLAVLSSRSVRRLQYMWLVCENVVI